MSQHTIIQGPTQTGDIWEDIKWVFGWDQPLQSFYLQKHDGLKDEEANPVVWVGGTVDTRMYEVEDLVKTAFLHGLIIDYEMQVRLYGEKDDGA